MLDSLIRGACPAPVTSSADDRHFVDQPGSAGILVDNEKHVAYIDADRSLQRGFERYVAAHGLPISVEGPDDMSAHIKASLIGSSVTIPIKNHRLNLGTWQGVYLCEFRDGGDTRKLSITIL